MLLFFNLLNAPQAIRFLDPQLLKPAAKSRFSPACAPGPRNYRAEDKYPKPIFAQKVS
jgi:hypothetical protein